MTGPPAGAAAARGSINSFRNDEQLEVLSAYFTEAAGNREVPFFTTVVFERPGDDIGMNWYLTVAGKMRIRSGFVKTANNKDDHQAAEANLNALQQLRHWWTAP